ncbi:hypothetical protein [Desulfofundulus sp.]|uniref:hypothetical protein n=1 Tax=Desulfofundulus sp. TaxID=2282750 RepID=UPI003C7836C5
MKIKGVTPVTPKRGGGSELALQVQTDFDRNPKALKVLEIFKVLEAFKIPEVLKA